MKLPIGIQTFSEIREENYVYIDKTKEAYKLIQSYKYVFLSRPRRFGKSLFLDTLRNIFEGKKEYFKDLYIEDKYDFSKTHPVIKISFSGELFTKEGITQTLDVLMLDNQENLGLTCEENLNAPNCFIRLLKKSYTKYKQKVVILIDEYDKPLLDNIANKEIAEFARDSLKAFYSVIKDNDEYIKFVFITGVSKFSKVSLFSGLNNLRDITLNPKYGNICGYTHEDVKSSFQSFLGGVNLEELKLWYNGYNFLKEKVYNPFDILLFCDSENVYENYWFATATPTFLIELIKKNNYYLPDLENIKVGKELLDSFEIENLDIQVLLFQTGYLTIKEVQRIGNKIVYDLKVPNLEVQISLNDVLLNMFLNNSSQKVREQNKAYLSLRDAKLDDFQKSLEALFSSLPYENYTNNNIQIYEGFYASVIYAYLASLGFPMSVEESTNRGKLDMNLLINNNRYVFEFKTTKENALEQIKKMKYYEKFLDEKIDDQKSDQKTNVYLVGINFDKEKRNVSLFEWEKFR